MPDPVSHAECFKSFNHAFFSFRPVNSGQNKRQFDILFGGKTGYQVKELENKTDLVAPDICLVLIVQIRGHDSIKFIDAIIRSVQQS